DVGIAIVAGGDVARGGRGGGVGEAGIGRRGDGDHEGEGGAVAGGDHARVGGGDDLVGDIDAEARAAGVEVDEPGGEGIDDGGGGGGGGGADVAHDQLVGADLADGEGGGVTLVEGDVGHAADRGGVGGAVVRWIDIPRGHG